MVKNNVLSMINIYIYPYFDFSSNAYKEVITGFATVLVVVWKIVCKTLLSQLLHKY